MGIESTYTYMKWPWLSKSSFSTYFYCKWLFYDSIIMGNKSEPNRIMKIGTGLHELYYRFFDLVDYDKLFTLDWETESGTHYNQVTEYFTELIMNELPDEIIVDGVKKKFTNVKFTNKIAAFALFESDHWYTLNKKYKSKASIQKYFRANPSDREYTSYNDEFMIYGTADRRLKVDEYKIIHDYKTGGVPPATIRDRNNKGWATCTAINSSKTTEGNFYCLLEIFNMGYTAKMQDYKNSKGEIGKRWTFFYKGKVKEDFRKWLGYSYLYTGGMEAGQPVYYFVKKKCSTRSLRTILNKLAIIRANDKWPREYDEYKCEKCGKYETDCRGIIPIELYGNRIEREEKYEISGKLCGREDTT